MASRFRLMICFWVWIRWACWIAVSRRLRSASDFGFILRVSRSKGSDGSDVKMVV